MADITVPVSTPGATRSATQLGNVATQADRVSVSARRLDDGLRNTGSRLGPLASLLGQVGVASGTAAGQLGGFLAVAGGLGGVGLAAAGVAAAIGFITSRSREAAKALEELVKSRDKLSAQAATQTAQAAGRLGGAIRRQQASAANFGQRRGDIAEYAANLSGTGRVSPEFAIENAATIQNLPPEVRSAFIDSLRLGAEPEAALAAASSFAQATQRTGGLFGLTQRDAQGRVTATLGGAATLGGGQGPQSRLLSAILSASGIDVVASEKNLRWQAQHNPVLQQQDKATLAQALEGEAAVRDAFSMRGAEMAAEAASMNTKSVEQLTVAIDNLREEIERRRNGGGPTPRFNR